MMHAKLKQVVQYIFWLIVVFLSLCLVGIALSYFNFETDYHFLRTKQRLLSNKIWLICFYVHLFFGAICILSGLPLFFNRLIDVHSRTHKMMGKIYIVSILYLTGPTGFYLAFFAEGGPWASLGFILMSFAWMIPTYIALQKIIQNDIEGHYRWMIRSYCMTLSGVTLRLLTPLGAWYLGIGEQTNFIITSYASWIINIIIGEIIVIYTTRNVRKIL